VKQTLFLRDDLAEAWRGNDPFRIAQQQQGTIFRNKEGRRTLRFEITGRGYFLKLHEGVGWAEIFKNLLQGRLPVIGASNEYRAIRALESLRIDTLSAAGFGRRGFNPAKQLSFLVTDELHDVISLEDFCRPWGEHPPAYALKRNLILRVAEIARRMHSGGINHRDFYLCHFMLDNSAPIGGLSIKSAKLHLMDLHRAQIRGEIPQRWLIKDLGGLYYSALDIGLTRRDVLRFIRAYRQQPLPTIFAHEMNFWIKVKQRARSIYLRDFKLEPRWPL